MKKQTKDQAKVQYEYGDLVGIKFYGHNWVGSVMKVGKTFIDVCFFNFKTERYKPSEVFPVHFDEYDVDQDRCFVKFDDKKRRILIKYTMCLDHLFAKNKADMTYYFYGTIALTSAEYQAYRLLKDFPDDNDGLNYPY